MAKQVKPSARGELEITTPWAVIPQTRQSLCRVIGAWFAWLDTGTHDSLMDASNFVATVEKRQGLKVACLEEIAWRNGWLDDEQLTALAASLSKNQYGQYLASIKAPFAPKSATSPPRLPKRWLSAADHGETKQRTALGLGVEQGVDKGHGRSPPYLRTIVLLYSDRKQGVDPVGLSPMSVVRKFLG